MEIIFLGTGTSEGVPHIGKVPSTLDLQNFRNWRTRSSVHVIMDNFCVQVDAAQEFRLQCIWNKINKIDLFILTHGHADHILGMDDLRRFCTDDKAILVYSTPEGLERIKNVYPYAIRETRKLSYPAFQLNVMPEILEVSGGTIYSTLLPHGNFQTLGLIFIEKSSGKKIVYFCDCKKIPQKGLQLGKNADIVILDGLRHEPPHPTHMTIPEAISVAQKLNATKSFLIHTTSLVDYETTQQKLPKNIFLSYDGLRLTI